LPAVQPPSLRDATDDDSWDLVALIGACWGEYPGCVMDVHGECRDLLAPATTYRQAGGWIGVLVDRCGTVVASVAYRRLDASTADMERLYVGRRWRRQGLAAGLVAEVEQRAARAGCSTMELWSDSRFVDAHAFYVRLGYSASGATRALGDRSATVEHHFAKAI
jgi:putative acetyltransferase